MFSVKSDYKTNNDKRPRLGQLFTGDRQVTTPHFSLGTIRGSTPNLTPDLSQTLPTYKTMQVSLGEVNSLIPALKSYSDAMGVEKPYHSMLCLREDQSVILSLRNPMTDLCYSAGRYVPTPEQAHLESQFPYQINAKLVASRSENGAVKMTPQEYLEKAKIFAPDILLLSGEDSGIADTKSRAEKTQRRNLEFVDKCLLHLPTLYKFDLEGDEIAKIQRPLIIAPIEGGSFLDKRQRYGGYMSRKGTSLWVDHGPEPKPENFADDETFKAELKKYKDKITNEGTTVPIEVDGFHIGGLGTVSQRKDRVDMINASLEFLENNDKEQLKRPHSRFRMTTTTGEPAELIDLLFTGIDYISATYPICLTDEGLAMNAPVTLQSLKDVIATPDFGELTQQQRLHRFNILNLRDEEYIEDNQPLSSSCACYTCQHHSRSYLNHLLNTQEMLAEVLLTLHNTYQYGAFFEHFKQLVELDHAYHNAEKKDETQNPPLDEWYELAQQVYVPHVHLLHRNVRRRYAHQQNANNPNTMNDEDVRE